MRKQLEDFGEPVSLPEVGASQAYAERSQRAMAIVGCLQDVCGENFNPAATCCSMTGAAMLMSCVVSPGSIDGDVTPTTILEYLATGMSRQPKKLDTLVVEGAESFDEPYDAKKARPGGGGWSSKTSPTFKPILAGTASQRGNRRK